MLRIMHRPVPALAALLLVGACDSEGASEASSEFAGCVSESSDRVTESSSGEIVVRATDAPCDVEFELVLRLEGEPEGTLPQTPIAVGPGGRWISATYAPGEFAVWSPDGQLERRIGLGEGDGPGEFGRVSDFAVDSSAETVYVFSNSLTVEVFSLAGEHLRGLRAPARASSGVHLTGGTIAMAASGMADGPRLLLVDEDSAYRAGPDRRFMFPAEVRAAGTKVWSAEAAWYQLDRHVLPSGEVDVSIRRDTDWFPMVSAEEANSSGGPLLQGFAVDPDQQLGFARLLILEPAPPPSGPEQPLQPLTPGDPPEGAVEVFTLDGRLLASTRFENGRQIPWPLSSGPPGTYWYRVNDDMSRSIDIFRAVLAPRADE